MDTPIRIEKAVPGDLGEVAALYGALCDHLAGLALNPCGWRREVYPTRETAEDWLRQDALYLLREGGRIAATLALTAGQPENYGRADWQVDAAADEVICVHTVATHPDFQGRGYAARLAVFAVEEARRRGAKALRLDVCDCNAAAIAAYERAGFRCVSRYDLFGLAPPYHLYRLMEIVL